MLCSKCYNAIVMVNYDFKSDILYIRQCLGLSQISFAEQVGLSRSNIARYEAGTIVPRQESLEKIYNYAFSFGFDINQCKAMLYEDNRRNNLLLFHGAREEIIGDVDTKHSRQPSDFGTGFYLGQSLLQANMWVAANKKSSTYCFYFKPDNLKGVSFSTDYRWMLAILYYRGELEGYEITDELENIIKEIESADYLIAPIADNQMYDTLDYFKRGLISDVACLHALNANNLGLQYVLKTEKACKALTPVDRFYLCELEREHYLSLKTKTSNDGKNKSLLAINKYRKEGKMFNEIFTRKG